MINIQQQIVLTLLLFCTATYTHAQTNEERIKQYIKEARAQKNDSAFTSIMLRADSFANAEKYITGMAEVNNALGSYYYSRDADKCIRYLQKANEYYMEAGNKKKATYCLQNIAFAYQEQKKDIPAALKYVQQAIAARIELKDTMELANMYKYIATLYGKLHNFNEGKRYVAEAINLYTIKQARMPIAVSYHDLAEVYKEEEKYDSCIYWYLKAKDTWQQVKGNPSRIYLWNSNLMEVYTKTNKLNEAEALYKENDTVNATAFYYTDQLSFYKASQAFFEKKKDKKMANEYMTRYDTMKDKLRKEGKIVE